MSSFSLTRAIALAALALAVVVTTVSGHGFTTQPRARGAMKCNRRIPNPTLDRTAPIDTCPQCNSCGGIGATSKGGSFKIFAPFDYERKAITLCGDPVGSNAHTKTGKFANTKNMPFAATYKAGSVANFEYDITANHKGYLEFYLCDVSTGGDVKNTPAFFKANCHVLERSPHPACEAGSDKDCGPIDPKFPTRFNVPCQDGQGDRVFGGDNGKMAFKIPDVAMKEAVVISYWLAANSCVPSDGFFQNYKYPSAWAGCGTPGRGLSTCGGGIMPEEFFSCSDVSVTGGAGGAKPAKATVAPADAATTKAAPAAATTAAYAAATTKAEEAPAAATTAAYAAATTKAAAAPAAATTAAYAAATTKAEEAPAAATTAVPAGATTGAYEAPASLPAGTTAPAATTKAEEAPGAATTAAKTEAGTTKACRAEGANCGRDTDVCCEGSKCEKITRGYGYKMKCVATPDAATEAPVTSAAPAEAATTEAAADAATTAVYVATTEMKAEEKKKVDDVVDKVADKIDEEKPAAETPAEEKKAGGTLNIARITQCLTKCLV